MSISSKIRSLIDEKRVRHKKLYDYLGITKGGYYAAMRRDNWKSDTLKQISDFFEVDYDYWFDDGTSVLNEANPEYNSKQTGKFLGIISKLQQENKLLQEKNSALNDKIIKLLEQKKD